VSIQLEAIKFNHNPSSATTDALNIRKNATQFVTVPEWRRGISINPEDSPAAYAKSEVAGNTVTIQARFSRLDPAITSAQVRAIDPTGNPPEGQGCLGFLLRLLYILIRALTGNVLGEVRERTVTFPASGQTDFLTFQLKDTRIHRVGVGARTTTWRWQYRLNRRSPWIDFATTQHRIYIILRVPSLPWQQTPYSSSNTQLPWTEVLDHACSWGVLATTPDDAATRVTQAVYNLGPGTVEYDCPGGGSTHYGGNVTAFLDRLRGGLGNGRYINCSDCATFVSTFANILGCDLWQSRMGYSFGLNPLLAIGSSVWQPACGWSGFFYHEVAWKGACTASDAVFDACLKVDGDADPTTAPHTALLVANMPFGNPGDGQYRDRLATPAGRPSCQPQPSTRVRRTVF
jgi:hypothetical protein